MPHCAKTIHAHVRECVYTGKKVWAVEKSGEVTIRNTDGETTYSLTDFNGLAWALLVVTDRVWVGCSSGYIQVFDSQKCTRTAEMKKHTACVHALVYTGGYVYSASGDATICCWEADTCQFVRQLTGHSGPVRCLQSKGLYLFSGSSDTTLGVWHNESFQRTAVLKGHTSVIRCLAKQLHAERIWSGSEDSTVRVWDVLGLKCIKVLTAHHGFVTSLLHVSKHVSRDSCPQMWSGSVDCTICIWNADSFHLLTRIQQQHCGSISHIAFVGSHVAADGQVWTSAADGTIKVWVVGNESPATQQQAGSTQPIVQQQIVTVPRNKGGGPAAPPPHLVYQGGAITSQPYMSPAQPSVTNLPPPPVSGTGNNTNRGLPPSSVSSGNLAVSYTNTNVNNNAPPVNPNNNHLSPPLRDSPVPQNSKSPNVVQPQFTLQTAQIMNSELVGSAPSLKTSLILSDQQQPNSRSHTPTPRQRLQFDSPATTRGGTPHILTENATSASPQICASPQTTATHKQIFLNSPHAATYASNELVVSHSNTAVLPTGMVGPLVLTPPPAAMRKERKDTPAWSERDSSQNYKGHEQLVDGQTTKKKVTYNLAENTTYTSRSESHYDGYDAHNHVYEHTESTTREYELQHRHSTQPEPDCQNNIHRPPTHNNRQRKEDTHCTSDHTQHMYDTNGAPHHETNRDNDEHSSHHYQEHEYSREPVRQHNFHQDRERHRDASAVSDLIQREHELERERARREREREDNESPRPRKCSESRHMINFFEPKAELKHDDTSHWEQNLQSVEKALRASRRDVSPPRFGQLSPPPTPPRGLRPYPQERKGGDKDQQDASLSLFHITEKMNTLKTSPSSRRVNNTATLNTDSPAGMSLCLVDNTITKIPRQHPQKSDVEDSEDSPNDSSLRFPVSTDTFSPYTTTRTTRSDTKTTLISRRASSAPTKEKSKDIYGSTHRGSKMDTDWCGLSASTMFTKPTSEMAIFKKLKGRDNDKKNKGQPESYSSASMSSRQLESSCRAFIRQETRNSQLYESDSGDSTGSDLWVTTMSDTERKQMETTGISVKDYKDRNDSLTAELEVLQQQLETSRDEPQTKKKWEAERDRILNELNQLKSKEKGLIHRVEEQQVLLDEGRKQVDAAERRMAEWETLIPEQGDNAQRQLLQQFETREAEMSAELEDLRSEVDILKDQLSLRDSTLIAKGEEWNARHNLQVVNCSVNIEQNSAPNSPLLIKNEKTFEQSTSSSAAIEIPDDNDESYAVPNDVPQTRESPERPAESAPNPYSYSPYPNIDNILDIAELRLIAKKLATDLHNSHQQLHKALSCLDQQRTMSTELQQEIHRAAEKRELLSSSLLQSNNELDGWMSKTQDLQTELATLEITLVELKQKEREVMGAHKQIEELHQKVNERDDIKRSALQEQSTEFEIKLQYTKEQFEEQIEAEVAKHQKMQMRVDGLEQELSSTLLALENEKMKNNCDMEFDQLKQSVCQLEVKVAKLEETNKVLEEEKEEWSVVEPALRSQLNELEDKLQHADAKIKKSQSGSEDLNAKRQKAVVQAKELEERAATAEQHVWEVTEENATLRRTHKEKQRELILDLETLRHDMLTLRQGKKEQEHKFEQAIKVYKKAFKELEREKDSNDRERDVLRQENMKLSGKLDIISGELEKTKDLVHNNHEALITLQNTTKLNDHTIESLKGDLTESNQVRQQLERTVNELTTRELQYRTQLANEMQASEEEHNLCIHLTEQVKSLQAQLSLASGNPVESVKLPQGTTSPAVSPMKEVTGSTKGVLLTSFSEEVIALQKELEKEQQKLIAKSEKYTDLPPVKSPIKSPKSPLKIRCNQLTLQLRERKVELDEWVNKVHAIQKELSEKDKKLGEAAKHVEKLQTQLEQQLQDRVCVHTAMDQLSEKLQNTDMSHKEVFTKYEYYKEQYTECYAAWEKSKEHERQLEQTRADLNDSVDKLSEKCETQQQYIEEISHKCERYKAQYQDCTTELDKAKHSLQEMNDLQQANDGTQVVVRALSNEVQQLRDELATAKEARHSTKAQAEEQAENEARELHEKIRVAEDRCESLERDCALLRDQCAKADETADKMLKDVQAGIDQDKKRLEEEFKALQDRRKIEEEEREIEAEIVRRAEESRKALEAQLEDMQAQMDVMQKTQEESEEQMNLKLEHAKQQLDEYSEESSQSRETIHCLEATIADLKSELEEARGSDEAILELKERYKRMQDELDNSKESNTDIVTHLKEVQAELLQTLEEEKESKQVMAQQLKDTQQQLELEMQDKQEQINLLESQITESSELISDELQSKVDLQQKIHQLEQEKDTVDELLAAAQSTIQHLNENLVQLEDCKDKQQIKISSLSAQLQQQESELRQQLGHMDSERMKYTAIDTAVNKTDERLRRAEKDLERAHECNDKIESEKQRLHTDNTKLVEKLSLTEHRAQELTEEVLQLRDEIVELERIESQCKDKEEECAALAQQLKQGRQQSKEYIEEIDKLKDDLLDKEKDLQHWVNRVRQLQDDRKELESNYQQARQSSEQLHDQLEKDSEVIESCKDKIVFMQKHNGTLTKDLQAQQISISRYKEDVDQLMVQIQSKENQITMLETKLCNERGQREELESQIDYMFSEQQVLKHITKFKHDIEEKPGNTKSKRSRSVSPTTGSAGTGQHKNTRNVNTPSPGRPTRSKSTGSYSSSSRRSSISSNKSVSSKQQQQLQLQQQELLENEKVLRHALRKASELNTQQTEEINILRQALQESEETVQKQQRQLANLRHNQTGQSSSLLLDGDRPASTTTSGHTPSGTDCSHLSALSTTDSACRTCGAASCCPNCGHPACGCMTEETQSQSQCHSCLESHIESEIVEKNQQILKLREDLEIAEKDNSDMRTRITEFQTILQQLTPALKQCQQEVEHSKKEAENYSVQLTQLTEQVAEKECMIGELKRKMNALQTALQTHMNDQSNLCDLEDSTSSISSEMFATTTTTTTTTPTTILTNNTHISDSSSSSITTDKEMQRQQLLNRLENERQMLQHNIRGMGALVPPQVDIHKSNSALRNEIRELKETIIQCNSNSMKKGVQH